MPLDLLRKSITIYVKCPGRDRRAICTMSIDIHNSNAPQYRHTQRAPLYLLTYAVGVIVIITAWFLRQEPLAFAALAFSAVVCAVIAESFRWLTVRDEGRWLAIRYGPLPIFSKRIPYDEITAADPDRTTFLDGWGIHWTPMRGWTYNLWGFDCVKITMGRRTVSVGSNDVPALVEFLKNKIRN